MGIIGAILGVIIFLFGLAWTQGLFGGATSKLDEARTFELVNRLRANVKESFFGQASYGATNPTNLVPLLTNMGKVPSSARSSVTGGTPAVTTATIVSPYGGAIQIRGFGRRFEIVIEDMDNETCLKLGSRFAGVASADFGVMNIRVATSVPATIHVGAPAVPTVAAVDTACFTGAGLKDLTVTFR